MFPIFIKISEFQLLGMTLGPFEIHWYGVLITIGFLLAVAVAMREGARSKVNPDQILDLCFWALLAGLVGSRIVFDIVNWESYYLACFDPAAAGLSEPACFEILKVWKGGLVWYGGLLGAIPVVFWFVRRYKLPFLKVADIMVPSVALGHGFGRMGCFAAGCCFGRPTDAATGVTFPAGSMAHHLHMERWSGLMAEFTNSLPIHPTQLYESVAEIGIFLLLVAVVRPMKRFHGQIFLTYLMLYALLRSVVEFFRGDHARGYLVTWDTTEHIGAHTLNDITGISTSQTISLLVAIGAMITIAVILHRKKDHGIIPVPVAEPAQTDGEES